MLADKLSVTPKTISRWENRQTQIPLFVEPALREILRNGPRVFEGNAQFTFVDLFAGIGGMRIGFESAGGRRVFTSEWNLWSQKTYRENFGSESIAGDITKVDPDNIPDHDVLLAGFPCQPFSIAGVSKKNALGRPHGFERTTQGTLFFDVERIITSKHPEIDLHLFDRVLILAENRVVVKFKEIWVGRESGWNLELNVLISHEQFDNASLRALR